MQFVVCVGQAFLLRKLPLVCTYVSFRFEIVKIS